MRLWVSGSGRIGNAANRMCAYNWDCEVGIERVSKNAFEWMRELCARASRLRESAKVSHFQLTNFPSIKIIHGN